MNTCYFHGKEIQTYLETGLYFGASTATYKLIVNVSRNALIYEGKPSSVDTSN